MDALATKLVKTDTKLRSLRDVKKTAAASMLEQLKAREDKTMTADGVTFEAVEADTKPSVTMKLVMDSLNESPDVQQQVRQAITTHRNANTKKTWKLKTR